MCIRDRLLRSAMMRNSTVVSSVVREEVGSSNIMIFESKDTAFMISTICLCATLRSQMCIRARPTEEQKKLLGIENEALLKSFHNTYLDNGDILEYIETYYIGSMYTYRVTL